jgi:hypothetical protein
MKTWIKRNKILFIFNSAILLSLGIAWILYTLFGHQLMETIYKSEPIGMLNKMIMTGRASIPLEDYYNRADRIMSTGSSVVIILCILTVAIKALLEPLHKKDSSTFANGSLRPILIASSRRKWMDAVILLVLAVGAGFGSLQGARHLDHVISVHDTWEWFEADIPRVYGNMTNRASNHKRTKVHPLFSLMSFPPVYVLRKVVGIQPATAVKIVFALVASLWVSALYILLRLVGCLRSDAVLFCVLGAVSAASMFWFVIPETYPFGSLSILVGLIVVGLAKYRSLPAWLYISSSALTLSITLTNWMVGILATFANYPWKRSLQLTVNAFCIVVLLWGVQKFIFPSAQFFIGDREEAMYILLPESGGPLYVLMSFLFHTMVMPAIKVVNRPDSPDLLMTTQLSLPGSGSIWGTIAVALWASLISLGLWALFAVKEHRQLRVVLGATLLGQLALHVLYGPETFLYALDFGPLLVVLAAFGALTRARLLALVLAGTLVISAGINNGLQFSKAIELLDSHINPVRRQALSEMRRGPSDSWLRDIGPEALASLAAAQ